MRCLYFFSRQKSPLDQLYPSTFCAPLIYPAVLNQLSANSTQVFWPNIFQGQRRNPVSWFLPNSEMVILTMRFSTVPVENVISRCSFQCILYIGFIIQRGCDIALEDLNNRTFLCHYLPPSIHLECVQCPFESSIPRWFYQLFFSTNSKIHQKFNIFRYLYSNGKYIQQKGIKMVKASIQK